MNQQIFDSIWTAEFVQKVLAEFESDPHFNFLCVNSPTFASFWTHETKPFIAKLALDFHKIKEEVWYPGLGGCLFYTDNTTNDRAIRIAFLQHEINRLTTKA